MSKKLIRLFTITGQLVLVSVFLTLMLSSSNLANNEVVVENQNLNKSSDVVNKLFLAKPMTLIPLEEVKEEVVEELSAEEEKEEVVVTEEVKEEEKEEEVRKSEPQILTSVNADKYGNYENAGFVVTYGNTTYSLNDGDLNLLVAVVAAEADYNENNIQGSTDDALGVISVILNRCEPSSSWSSYVNNGTNPIAQISAPNQFSVYSSGAYNKFMPGGSMYNSNKYNIARQAVVDALNGVRNNNYLGFNAWYNTGYSQNYVLEGGNRYR